MDFFMFFTLTILVCRIGIFLKGGMDRPSNLVLHQSSFTLTPNENQVCGRYFKKMVTKWVYVAFI